MFDKCKFSLKFQNEISDDAGKGGVGVEQAPFDQVGPVAGILAINRRVVKRKKRDESAGSNRRCSGADNGINQKGVEQMEKEGTGPMPVIFLSPEAEAHFKAEAERNIAEIASKLHSIITKIREATIDPNKAKGLSGGQDIPEGTIAFSSRELPGLLEHIDNETTLAIAHLNAAYGIRVACANANPESGRDENDHAGGRNGHKA